MKWYACVIILRARSGIVRTSTLGNKEILLPLNDDADLRGFLTLIMPGLVIDGVPAPSGQRVVYFCHFDSATCETPEWLEWGNVVLKVSEGVSTQAIAYIQREIKILNELNSPGYPKLLYDDVITHHPESEDRLRYSRFVTIEERIESNPLNEVLDQYKTEESVMNLLYDLITVLRPLWERKPGLVHRDIKPQNILITPAGEVVVIDLGLLREEGAKGVTLTSAEMGPCTPIYASPEQAKNDKCNISFRSDHFTLGTLCYELLSGSNPFYSDGDLLDVILSKVLTQELPKLSDLGVCSPEFSSIIEKMMSKQPYKRYRRIEDLVNDLDKIRGKK